MRRMATRLANENPEGLGAYVYNLRFPGQYFDKETNHHYNHHRDYESTSGRYVQSDPIGLYGGLNTYLYGNAYPLFYVDPHGLLGWADMPDVPDWLLHGSAGFGDTLSFGLTSWIRDLASIGSVEKCSGWYTAGEIGGAALGLGFGGMTLGRHAVANGWRSVFLESRTGSTVSRRWHRRWGGGEHLDHMFVQQSWGSVHAGWNLVPLSPWVNSVLLNPQNYKWDVYSRFIPYLGRGAAQISTVGMWGAPGTAAVSGLCGCD